MWGVPGSFIWISRGRVTCGDKWVSCARTERRHSGWLSLLCVTAPQGLCLCVTVCPASVAGRLRELVSVGLCVCVSLHRGSCHYPHLQATEEETQLLIAGPRVLCVSWDLCHRTKRSLRRRILSSLWNPRTSGQERLGNTMAQVPLCRNGGNRMHMTGGQRSCGRGKRAPSQKF